MAYCSILLNNFWILHNRRDNFHQKRIYSQNCAKNDITLDTMNGYLTILLRYFKTDQSGKGVTLILSQTDTSICPVKSIKKQTTF